MVALRQECINKLLSVILVELKGPTAVISRHKEHHKHNRLEEANLALNTQHAVLSVLQGVPAHVAKCDSVGCLWVETHKG